MSPRFKKSCDSKQRYESEARAKRQAAVERARGAPRLSVYHCEEWCGGWHLTKKGWAS